MAMLRVVPPISTMNDRDCLRIILHLPSDLNDESCRNVAACNHLFRKLVIHIGIELLCVSIKDFIQTLARDSAWPLEIDFSAATELYQNYIQALPLLWNSPHSFGV